MMQEGIILERKSINQNGSNLQSRQENFHSRKWN